jgi:hypothetical protein
MLDKIIEFKKEFGWHGLAFTVAIIGFILWWYTVEIIDIFHKMAV